METNKYINELKKLLSRIDSLRRDEILKELKSHIDEENETYETLVNKFGSPEELAKKYLEDLPQKDTFSQKAVNKSKKGLMILGLLVVLFFVALIIFFNYYSKDDFDYSKYNAKTIDEKTNGLWTTQTEVRDIEIEQAKVVFYWWEQDEVKYNCEGDNPTISEVKISFRHTICYVKVPKKHINFNILQSSTTFIKPDFIFNINAKQSEIKIDFQQEKYNFEAKLDDSIIKNIKSYDDGIKVNINMRESVLKKYEY